MAESFNEIYQNLIQAFARTGKIGRTRPRDAEHARRIAWATTNRIINKNKKLNTTVSQSRQGTEPLTGSQNCCQLKLFSIIN